MEYKEQNKIKSKKLENENKKENGALLVPASQMRLI
jgi:hypothetical protein